MTIYNAETLLNIGFRDLAGWTKCNDGSIRYEPQNAAEFDARNALYAFVHDDKVCYVGKTARSIKRRFIGYCRPGLTQKTNKRCHEMIKAALDRGGSVRVFAFAPINQLSYGPFEINLAAALEESIIISFAPPWNTQAGSRRMTETEEEEASATEEQLSGGEPFETHPEPVTAGPMPKFQIELGKTYFNQGFINPGVSASKHLGKDGDPIIIYLGNTFNQVDSSINRTANRNGSVRIVGGNGRLQIGSRAISGKMERCMP